MEGDDESAPFTGLLGKMASAPSRRATVAIDQRRLFEKPRKRGYARNDDAAASPVVNDGPNTAARQRAVNGPPAFTAPETGTSVRPLRPRWSSTLASCQ